MKTDETLISAATCAYRARDAEGRLLADPAWMDLDADGRHLAYEETRRARRIEAARDPDNLSTTARAVLSRITRR